MYVCMYVCIYVCMPPYVCLFFAFMGNLLGFPQVSDHLSLLICQHTGGCISVGIRGVSEWVLVAMHSFDSVPIGMARRGNPMQLRFVTSLDAALVLKLRGSLQCLISILGQQDQVKEHWVYHQTKDRIHYNHIYTRSRYEAARFINP